MAWNLIGSETHVLKRDKALEFAAKHASLPHSPVERDFKESRFEMLVNVLREDQATAFFWVTVELNGVVIRMNGQHSSRAILEVGKDNPDQIVFHMDRYRADTPEDVIDLFRQIDSRHSSRTVDDIAGAHQGFVPELVGLNHTHMKIGAKGVAFRMGVSKDGVKPTGDEVLSLIQDPSLTEYFKWVDSAFNGRVELKKVEVVAAMYATYQVSPVGAARFWGEVGLGINGFTNDRKPGAILITELVKASEDPSFRKAQFPYQGATYLKCIKAWGAFCAGQLIDSLKISPKRPTSFPEPAHYNDEQMGNAA